jgi:RHS repeat-associated protein
MALAFEAATVAGDGGLALAASSAKKPQAASGARNAAPRPLGPAQAQDFASARLMARLQNRRIEVLGARTDASQTFVNTDGSVTYTVSAQPVRVKRNGAWVNLDATLQLGADGRVAPVATESALSLSGGGSGALVSMTVDGRNVSLAWPSKLPMPVLSGDTATYANVLNGVDLQVTASVTGGVEETLVVRTAAAAADPALADLVQSVSGSSGVSAATDTGGNLSVKDAKGRLLVNSPAPVMWDSATDAAAAGAAATPAGSGSRGAPAPGTRSTAEVPGSRAHQAGVTVHVQDRKLHLAADHGLLTSKSTVFPVYIDPAYVPHPASGSTLHYDEVQQAYPTTSNWGVTPSGGLAVGYQGFSSPTGIERTYYNLSVPSSIWGAVIESAKLNAKVSYASASGSNSTTVNVFSACAISTSTTWNNQPCKNQTANPNYPGPNAAATFTTTSNSPNLPVTFDVTSGMQKIADMHNTNWTLGFFNATETNDVDRVKFANNPTFSITYNHRPSKPTQVAPAAGASTNDTTPALQASSTDADQDTVRELFQIDQADGTTVVASGYSPYVNSGATATWSPTTALADGTYEWHASSYDGHNWWSPNSDWTAWRTLTVDTKAPGTSSISSGDFPSGAWSGTPDASGNFSGAFTFTPPASDTASVVWTLDGGAAHTLATTGAAVSDTLTFPAGKHTVSVTTHDKAGNVSSATSYVFYAGSGAALLTPAAGDRPARRVSLTAQGKSTETGVTYQYRIGETDTWHDVPTADVTVTSSGTAVPAWPLAAPGGAPSALTWNITDTLAQDGPVDVRAVFTDGTTGDNSPANTITVDRNAGSAPSLTAGPASVNALTGDASISATDASGFDMTVSRTASSRRPANGSAQEGQVAIFGPQWTAGTTAEITDSDWSYLHRTSGTSVAVVDVDGDPTGFTATSGGAWKPEPGAEDLTLTGSLTGTFTLKDSDGTTTTFAKVDPAATAWQVVSTFLPTSNSTTQVVSEKVTSGTQTLARPKYVIAPTSAVTQSTCAATPSARGCRVLEYVYAGTTTATASAFGDYAGQVSQIRLWATDPGASAATAVTVAQYAYDTAGRLRQEWDPRISPALKTAYDYDSAGRITTLTPPGELPWSLAYDKVGSAATAGDGMLVSASRPTLTPGSASQTDGTAITSVVYDVPLQGTDAPYAMGGGDVAAWGQADPPADATAVFPADAVPSSHDGAALGSGDYRRATVTYTDASGREVNTADPGGHTTTTEYDRFGNTVRELTAANRELALATSGAGLAEQQQLGIDTLSSADRAQLLSTTSVFNAGSVSADAGTDKDTDPANVGQRELEKLGPLHMVTLTSTLHAVTGGTDLPAGSQLAAREHTVTAYDQGRPTDGTATVANQPTTVSVGAQALNPGAYVGDGDVRTSTTGYDWVKGLATRTVTDPAGLNLVKTTSYDAQGRVIRTTLPMSSGTDAGATLTTYWSATGTGACNGRPEWADLVCSVGPAATVTGGGSNPTELPTKTTTYDRWGNTATVADTADGATRTTTTSHDAAGRDTGTSVTGGAGTAVPDTTTTYDPATGQEATTSAGGHTIARGYDALGRLVSYDDGAGNTAVTWYDALDRPTRVTDSAPSTTTYTYDTTADPRGLETSRTDSVAGTFAATYDADGDLATEALPGGYMLTLTRDEAGAATGRTYTRDSDGTEVTQDIATETVQGQQATHSSDTGDQTYGYDAAGRLTAVDDTQDGITTHRAYTFDDNTNRTGLTTTVDNPDGTAGTPATSVYTYDSADRLQTGGGTGPVVYDAFGRTTTQATGATIGYYTNDLVRRQTSADGTTRQTWSLDAAQRLASWTTEANTSGTWTQTGAKTSHYGSDGDSPDWVAEDAAGTVTRNVQGIGGDLAATTGASDATSTDLMLTNLHGDVTVQLPLDTTVAPTVLGYDEFGNPDSATPEVRYGWLGGKQRSSETVTGAVLMGVRLFDPSTGRFLSTDPVPGGSADAYDYCNGDPVNCFDIDGQWPHVHWHNPFHVNNWSPLHSWSRGVAHGYHWTARHYHWTTRHVRRYSRRYGGPVWHWASRTVHNHYVRACFWGGGSGIGISIVTRVASKFWWPAAAVGCAFGLGQRRWS